MVYADAELIFMNSHVLKCCRVCIFVNNVIASIALTSQQWLPRTVNESLLLSAKLIIGSESRTYVVSRSHARDLCRRPID